MRSRHRGAILGVGVLACLGGTGFGYALASYGPWKDRSPAVVAKVNGQPVLEPDLNLALQLRREEAIEELVRHTLVEQEAKRKGIDVQVTPDLKEPDPQRRQALYARARGDALLRKLILAEVGDSTRQEIFRHFRDELSLHEVSYLVVTNQEDLKGVKEGLRKGLPFGQLAQSFTADERTRADQGRLGWVNVPELKSKLGPYVGEAVLDLKVGEVSPPLPSPVGTIFVHLQARRDRFEDVESDIEDLIVEARIPEFLHRLSEQAGVSNEKHSPQ